MRSASALFKQALAENKRNYLLYADVTLSNGQTLSFDNATLWSDGFSTEDAVSDDEAFTAIGATIINAASITINNITGAYTDTDFKGAEVILQCGLSLSSGVTELKRLGTYDVEDTTYNGATVTLSLLDRMAQFERPYSESRLTYPNTLEQIVINACQKCGVPLNTYDFPHKDFVVQSRPDDDAVTFREVIGWAAAIAGCYARCNTNGQLELKWFDTSGDADHEIASLFSQDICLDDTVITGVTVETTDADSSNLLSFRHGASGHMITISQNGFITAANAQSVADLVGNVVEGLQFRKLRITALSDPTREAGDTVTVTDHKGHSYFALITRCNFHPFGRDEVVSGSDRPERNSATRYSSATKSYVEARKLLKHEKTLREQQLENLARFLTRHSSGLYFTKETTDDGNIYYLHDQEQLDESQIIWKITADAWGVSTDGGQTWNAGITAEGDIVARILTATGINADWINAGTFAVYDDQDHLIFEASKDLHRVYINGDNVQIGGEPLPNALNNTTSFYVSLSNEHQAISTDSSGSYGTFPTCQTKATVFYGSRDVSASCTYSASASTGVTGSWNNSTRIYTVTGLSTDSGYVDITATYNGASTTKRFTLSKVRDGSSGEDAAVLKIDSSRGNVFKSNAVSTVLTVTVYIGGDRITNITELRSRFGTGAYLQWYWLRLDDSTYGEILSTDSKLSNNGFSLTLTPADVDTKVTFRCELVVP